LLLGAGVALALFSGLLAALAGVPFLAGQWLTLYLFGQEIKVGSVLLFDIGVYLVVIGAVLTMVFSLEEL
jgi:multicomponent Na+:H+ antiporter subunit B